MPDTMTETAGLVDFLVGKSLDWLDAEADKFAREIDLPAMIKNIAHVGRLSPDAPAEWRDKFIASLEERIEAITHLCFVEGFYRGYNIGRDSGERAASDARIEATKAEAREGVERMKRLLFWAAMDGGGTLVIPLATLNENPPFDATLDISEDDQHENIVVRASRNPDQEGNDNG